ILVGRDKYDEIVGISGEAPDRIRVVVNVEEVRALRIPDLDKVVAFMQIILSVDDMREIIDVLKARFPRLVTPAKEDICYATQNRQDAVKQLAKEVDLVLVIGSRNSENSNQLCRVARLYGAQAFLINNHHDIESDWLQHISQIG